MDNKLYLEQELALKELHDNNYLYNILDCIVDDSSHLYQGDGVQIAAKVLNEYMDKVSKKSDILLKEWAKVGNEFEKICKHEIVCNEDNHKRCVLCHQFISDCGSSHLYVINVLSDDPFIREEDYKTLYKGILLLVKNNDDIDNFDKYVTDKDLKGAKIIKYGKKMKKKEILKIIEIRKKIYDFYSSNGQTKLYLSGDIEVFMKHYKDSNLSIVPTIEFIKEKVDNDIQDIAMLENQLYNLDKTHLIRKYIDYGENTYCYLCGKYIPRTNGTYDSELDFYNYNINEYIENNYDGSNEKSRQFYETKYLFDKIEDLLANKDDDEEIDIMSLIQQSNDKVLKITPRYRYKKN